MEKMAKTGPVFKGVLLLRNLLLRSGVYKHAAKVAEQGKGNDRTSWDKKPLCRVLLLPGCNFEWSWRLPWWLQ